MCIIFIFIFFKQLLENKKRKIEEQSDVQEENITTNKVAAVPVSGYARRAIVNAGRDVDQAQWWYYFDAEEKVLYK